MSIEKFFTYRGDVRAVATTGNTLTFVTVHPEGQPTAIYRLDPEKVTLSETALPTGGQTLLVIGDDLWVAGTDRRLYHMAASGGKPTARGGAFDAELVALAPLSGERLAVAVGPRVLVLARADARVLQTLDTQDAATCLASDPTGQWLAVGTAKGTVFVFECETAPDEFRISDSAPLHEAAVTALLFEADELRFLSSGADQKLLSTHARGRLEAEDRGRGANHEQPITAMIAGPHERFFTGSGDSSLKSWPRAKAARPVTLKDGVAKVVALAVVPVHGEPQIAAACEDNTLRLFKLDGEGKFGDATLRVQGVDAWARNELGQSDPKLREATLRTLAGFNDAAAIKRIGNQMTTDADHALRLLACRLLGESSHPHAAKALEKGLDHREEAVRLLAFDGLRKHAGPNDLRPLALALKAGKADVGMKAVQALEALARRDDQALAQLTNALQSQVFEVRRAALTSLEAVYGADSPEASLTALAAPHADLRRLALLRLMQRRLLNDPRVQAALRWRGEDQDPEVRRVAFLLSLYTRDRLLRALRQRDAELQRQLTELESSGDGTGALGTVVQTVSAAVDWVRDKVTGQGLGADDLTPLLQATASRALDTCLRGASGLAVLGDPRAFGLLLQLSREQNTGARVDVCRALAALGDPRATDRLRSMLYDPEAAVRDAAFSGLARLQAAQPLQYASAGLNASFEDVRRRGLEALVRFLRESPADAARAGPALEMLVRALNDSSAAVRGEAFKSALNVKAGGGGLHTLRFILQSIHPDVRLEVMTEALAQVEQPWAWNLLLEFYNDADAGLRHEAFTAATNKNKELPPLEAALVAQYPDVRRLSVEALIKKHTAPAQALLVRALADADKDVRQLALGALVGEGARGPLAEALTSPHADVRVRAARALARHGDAAALKPLLDLATAPEPQERERVADWLALAESALEGVAELGDSSALAALVPLLQSKHASLRKLSIRALMWVALPHHRETLQQALLHSDPVVKYNAALGLAYSGDPLVASLVFSTQADAVLSKDEQFVAAFTLGPAGDDRLALFLDDADESLRARALLLLMLLELADPRGAPARCLTCLSARPPRVRLAAAGALERFADRAAFREYVVQLVNDRGDEPAWKIPAETVDTLGALLAHGTPKARARTAHLLRNFAEKEPAAWEQGWALHIARFAADIRTLRDTASERKPPAPQYTAGQLRELAFGAYVGLVREQGGATAAGYGTEPQVVRVRQTALSRLQAMAKAGNRDAVLPVFVQALGDPNQAVRLQAFDQLAALDVDADTLGAAALGAGHTDIGVRGLEKLAGGGKTAEGQAVLEEALKNRTDDLAAEAAKLLAARRDIVSVAGIALGAAHEPLRSQAVDWLAAEYDAQDAGKREAARDALRQALLSRHNKVVARAAFALAVKKDPAAFDALVKLLRKAKEEGPQRRVIETLKGLGDPRAADAFLDRVEDDPEGTALTDLLFESAGSFRRPETADRLLRMGEKEKWGKALAAAHVVSGYDQEIEDPEDESADRRWEQKQFPRHDAILAKLLRRATELKATRSLAGFLSAARWARGRDVDPELAVLTVYAADDIRRRAVEAVGWRLRKRGGPAEPLVKALKHRDPETQFLAAEGLGRGGRVEGLSPLLAAVDLQENLALRQRAVQALGELGDPRAFDLLLKIVNDPEHALRDEAAEALGHMGKSPRAHEIMQLLEDLVRGGGQLAAAALRGLRWFDHPEGWQLIRRHAGDARSSLQSQAVQLLGYNDDPATRELLLKLLAESPTHYVVTAATESARRLWGSDSLEPDYAAIRNTQIDAEELDAMFRRLQERGDARRMLEILPRLEANAAQRVKGILLGRQPLPVAEAETVAAGPDAAAAGVAAHLLGRAGAASSGPVVDAALRRWWGEWDKGRREESRRGAQAGKQVGRLLEPLRVLVWAAGRLGAAADVLTAIATTRADVPFDRVLRRDAVAALATGKPTAQVLAALETLAAGDDPEVRGMVAQAVARDDPARAATVAGRVLSDRVAFNRVAVRKDVNLSDTLHKAAGQVHYQGVAVPYLAARRDVPALAAVANNRGLSEETRLGAVEGLAASASEPGEKQLEQIGRGLENPEALRKAAWRGLRRSRRARQQ
jgi:ParB family chromosome partitioning protein